MKKDKLAYILATILAFSSCKKAAYVEPIVEQSLIASNFAGSNGPSFSNGTAEGAAFATPTSMVIDASGNLYVADNGNRSIRKVTPDGAVTLLAGDRIGGYQDGTGNAAKFGDGNNTIAIDVQNNLYLADVANSCIRKITPAGVVSTLVGAPGRSNLDGPIATAGVSLTTISDIAVDASNNIYFIDTKGIRKISADGNVSTILKSGTGTTTYGPIALQAIVNPQSLTTDKAGNIYVSSRGSNENVIVKISTDGIVSQLTGKGIGYNNNVVALAARIGDTKGMCVDKNGNLYMGDAANRVVTKITTDGYARLVAGIPTPTGSTSQIFKPGPAFEIPFGDVRDVAVDANGNVYVLEFTASSIRKISLVDNPSSPPTQDEIDKATWNKPGTWK